MSLASSSRPGTSRGLVSTGGKNRHGRWLPCTSDARLAPCEHCGCVSPVRWVGRGWGNAPSRRWCPEEGRGLNPPGAGLKPPFAPCWRRVPPCWSVPHEHTRPPRPPRPPRGHLPVSRVRHPHRFGAAGWSGQAVASPQRLPSGGCYCATSALCPLNPAFGSVLSNKATVLCPLPSA